MLKSIQIKNYKSIIDTTIDLEYGEAKAPNGYKAAERLPFLGYGVNGRIVPCLAVYGANAAGKSNLMEAVALLKHLAADAGATVATCYSPNKLTDMVLPTEFKVEYIQEEKQYTYRIAFNADQVVNEELSDDEGHIFRITGEEVSFERLAKKDSVYNDDKFKEILSVECTSQGKQKTALLNKLINSYASLNKPIKDAGAFFLCELQFLATDTLLGIIPEAVKMLAKLQGDKENAENLAMEEILETVRQLDIDIRDISIVEQKVSMQDLVKLDPRRHILKKQIVNGERSMSIIDITTRHSDINGQSVEFNFLREESEGTKKLVACVALFLLAVKLGRVVFIDEMDRSLHPLLLKELLKFFTARRYNVKKAQLVFTSHTTELLEDETLRISEIGILSKTLKTGTLLKRLSDIKKEEGTQRGIRNEYNHRLAYLDGYYSGVPFPSI